MSRVKRRKSLLDTGLLTFDVCGIQHGGSIVMEKLYVQERRPNGETSTVGLYYSREEAEDIIGQLRKLPEKQQCEYTITEAPA